MPVHIGQMTTDISAEAAPASNATAEAPAACTDLERFRKTSERLTRMQLRTRAHAFDD